MNEAEALQEVRRLVGDGYTVLPADNPARGMRGYAAFKQVNPNTSVSELVEWPIFSEPLTVTWEKATPDELLEFVQQPGVVPCDDPKALIVGFVQYEPKQGKALVKQTKIASLKGSPAWQAIHPMREALQQADEQRRRGYGIHAAES